MTDSRIKAADGVLCVVMWPKDPQSGRGYCVNQKLPMASFDAQSNETPRAKAAEVAVGKRMLELERE